MYKTMLQKEIYNKPIEREVNPAVSAEHEAGSD